MTPPNPPSYKVSTTLWPLPSRTHWQSVHKSPAPTKTPPVPLCCRCRAVTQSALWSPNQPASSACVPPNAVRATRAPPAPPARLSTPTPMPTPQSASLMGSSPRWLLTLISVLTYRLCMHPSPQLLWFSRPMLPCLCSRLQ